MMTLIKKEIGISFMYVGSGFCVFFCFYICVCTCANEKNACCSFIFYDETF